jgi:YjbE family integral membrane protein
VEPGSAVFWIGLAQIVWVDLLLSGDNAVVIALAARSLPPRQQRRAILLGSAAAIAMRVLLTLVAVQMLTLPWLKLAGAVLLVYIGVKLLRQDPGVAAPGAAGIGMFGAIRTILLADVVMSLDNVIAVAAAAKDSIVLLATGLAVSIPVMIFGSTMLLKVIGRFPALVWFGAALLGFIAGELLVADPALGVPVERIQERFQLSQRGIGTLCGAAGAALVVGIGKLIGLRRPRAKAA